MKCPFRLNKLNNYVEMECSNGSSIPVLESVTEEYPDCYEDCAYRRWSVELGGYYCAQAAILDDNIDLGIDEEEE